MDDFLFKLQQLIAKNRIEEVIKILLNTFQKCESERPESKGEVQGLRNQIVLLSARYNETNDKINSGIIDPVHAGTAKNQLISAFLNTIGKLPEHKEVASYINGLEEEEAWKDAVRKNDIESYRVFFTKYPHGKYKEETRRIISEMEAIEKTKEEKIKQTAAAEKRRRIIEEERHKSELQAGKEKGKKAAEEKVKKAKEELEKLELQKQKIIDQKLKAKADLAKMKKKPVESSTKSTSIPLAASGFAAGIAATSAKEENKSQTFFQRSNWIWFALPFIVLICMSIIVDGTNGFFFWIVPPILYVITAFKFPVKPKRNVLISTALSGLFCAIVLNFSEGGIYIGIAEFLFFGFIIFFVLSVLSLITLFIRNKSLDKKSLKS